MFCLGLLCCSFTAVTCTMKLFNPFRLSVPHFFWLWQKWVYQSIQRHTGLIHPLNFLTFGHYGAQDERQSARMSKNYKKCGLDQYDVEHSEV